MKKFPIQNTQNPFLQILSRWVILNKRKTNSGKKLKSDVFKALLILTQQFRDILAYLADFSLKKSTVSILQQKLYK